MERTEDNLPALLAVDPRRHFPRVVEAYQHRLFTFACRLTGSALDAEDIVQEALVRAYVACVTYPSARVQVLELQPWLYKITLNEFHHAIRGARLHVVPIDDDSPALGVADVAEMRPDALIESQEQLAALEAAVARLPERYRVPIVCCYFEQLSYQEVAVLLDQPLGTVKSSIYRGIRLLRTMLGTSAHDGKEDTVWTPRIPGNMNA